MPAIAVVALLVALAAPVDTSANISAGQPVSAGPVAGALATGVSAESPRAGDDTTSRRKRRSVEVSDWYERRLRIHRYGSFAVYPLFAVQAIAGNQLYPDPRGAPQWAKNTHRASATALAGVFGLNTVTGLWNLWDSRGQPGSTKRYIHSFFMLASDAGFTYAGARLADQAENSAAKRREHRTWAYGSMAATLTGVAVIKFWPDTR